MRKAWIMDPWRRAEQKTGTQKTGTQKTGTQKTGTQKIGTRRGIQTVRFNAKSSCPDEGGNGRDVQVDGRQ